MPFKDPIKRKEKSKQYGLNYREKKKQDPTLCTACFQPKDDASFKKCSKCREYMKQYKATYRLVPKAPGICSATDCTNQALENHKLCSRCLERGKQQEAKPHSKKTRRDWLKSLKPAALAAYGGKCACCGDSQEERLSIDHIDGYVDGPRGGTQLYSWLKQRNYPEGFRVLCMTCNFTLGHHGYCPHSNLTQVRLSGRPRIHPLTQKAKVKAIQHKMYMDALKMQVLQAYGGPRCVCCGEDHMECLSIDHIEGNGAAHRRELTGNPADGRNFYIWLRKNNFPPGFRVLCHGCNFSLGRFGFCMHTSTMQKSSTGESLVHYSQHISQ